MGYGDYHHGLFGYMLIAILSQFSSAINKTFLWCNSLSGDQFIDSIQWLKRSVHFDQKALVCNIWSDIENLLISPPRIVDEWINHHLLVRVLLLHSLVIKENDYKVWGIG